MKNYIFYLFLILFSVDASCQEGVIRPLSGPVDNDIITGTYYRDNENLFLPYIGTWQATWNNKTFTLTIQKIPKNKELFPNGEYWYEDRLIGRYKIVDATTGSVLEETPNFYTVNNAKLTNAGTGKNNKLTLSYFDVNLCSVSGKVWLERDPNNNNQLQYSYFKGDFWIQEGCPYTFENIPVPIPIVPLLLNRVN
ncbi:MAG TPA: DUF6705 family protein [Flavobacterium sp.]